MSKTRLALGALCVAFSTAAADPYAGYIYPAGIQVGTTNRFLIGGQALQAARDLHFSGDGLNVLDVEFVPNFPNPDGRQRRHLLNWLDGIHRGDAAEPELPEDPHLDEWRSNRWWTVLGTLDAGKIAIVERDLHTPRNALQATPSLRQMMLVTIAAEADATPGTRSYTVFGPNGMSAPRPFLVSAAPRITEPLYTPPSRGPANPAFADATAGTVMLDGQIYPGETDSFHLRLAGGRAYAFTVTARELQPFIGDAVPGFFNAAVTLKDARGTVVASADDAARFRPDPVLVFMPPGDATYTLEIRDVLYRGRADFVYSVTVGEAAEPVPPANATGIVDAPGKTSVHTFEIDEPGPRVLEVTARRRGSPLDAVLTLRKEPNGPVLGIWDDVTNTVFAGTIAQGECDPIGRYDFAEPGRYRAEVTDRTGHGGPDYAWWLDIRKPSPDFEVRSTRSTLPLKRGQPLKTTFRVIRRDGFTGPVVLAFPSGIRSTENVITAGTDTVTTELLYTGQRSTPVRPVEIAARADIGGRTLAHAVIPCDEYEQAFAWKHLVPADTFLFRGFVPQPGRKNGKQKKRKRP